MSESSSGGASGDIRPRELIDLIHRCLDGVATPLEVAELDRLVASDPVIARHLATAARLESSLEVVMRASLGDLSAAEPPYVGRWRGGRTIWKATAAIGVAAAAVALAWPLVRSKQPAEAVAFDSTSVPGRKPAAASRTTPASSVPKPDVRAGAYRSRLHFSDGSVADLRDDASRVETRVSTATAIDLALMWGGARFEVAHRPGRRFRIWVASSYIEVIGTVFSVERLATGVRVSVERGTVKVVSGRSEKRLSAGAAETIPLDTALDATSDRIVDRSRFRAPQPVQPGLADDKRRTAGAKDESGMLLKASEDARRLGRPLEALRLLKQFLEQHGSDPRAPYVAFISGRVLLEELSRPQEAAVAFARVEALNPGTPLVQDALVREVESWHRAGDADMARLRAREFLGRYPNGPRADEVRRYGRLE